MFLDDLLLFLLFFIGWLLFLWVLKKTGKISPAEEPSEPREAPEVRPGGTDEPRGTGFALQGPFLMWKTRRDRQLIDRIAQRRRFWRLFGDASIAGVLLAMVSMTVLLVWLPRAPGEGAAGRGPRR